MFVHAILLLAHCDAFERDTDYPSNDIQAGGISGRVPKVMQSAEECRKACVEKASCAGFTYIMKDKDKHNCALKSVLDSGTKRRDRGCISGKVTESCRKDYEGISF